VETFLGIGCHPNVDMGEFWDDLVVTNLMLLISLLVNPI
jgi:hypothetical protein